MPYSAGYHVCAHLPSVCISPEVFGQIFAHLYSSCLFSCFCSFNSNPIQPPPWPSEGRDELFFQRKTPLFCFSPCAFVFQLYLPPLAEICLCAGQTVFPPLSLFHASALLLDPQWQWRGTLVFNLLSHSQILCFQVINLCCPIYCMLHVVCPDSCMLEWDPWLLVDKGEIL